MARPSKKTIYEKIKIKTQEIIDKEQELEILKQEVEYLRNERDKQEMEQLFSTMKENGLSLKKAVELLKSNEPDTTTECADEI